MLRRVISSAVPSFPRFIMPCPNCGGQMLVAAVEPKAVDPDFTNVTHKCSECACTVTRMIGPQARERLRRAVSDQKSGISDQ